MSINSGSSQNLLPIDVIFQDVLDTIVDPATDPSTDPSAGDPAVPVDPSIDPSLDPALDSGVDPSVLDPNDPLIYSMGGMSEDDLFDWDENAADYEGGNGNDVADLSAMTSAAIIDLLQNLFETTLSTGDKKWLMSSIEKIVGSIFDDRMSGDGMSNEFDGGEGSDHLAGGGGNDRLHGGKGQDHLAGDAGDDSLDGGDGSDSLDGGAGADAIAGGAGADTESGGAGDDTMHGNNDNDVERGGTGNDSIYGDAGADKLNGDAGNDSVTGGAGNDVLKGGAGRDTLSGGTGADVFKFEIVSDSGKTVATRDVIKDFTHHAGNSSNDHIDVSSIDANGGGAGNGKFAWIGTGKFTGHAGQLHFRLEDHAGAAQDKTIIEGDINGDKVADFQIEITGLRGMYAGDFVL